MQQRAKKMWIRYGSVAVILLAAYFINVEYQSFRGEQAREATGFDSLPFEEALVKSKQTGQPILANLSAVWCPTCRILEEKIFSDPAINTKIRNDYIFTRLEYESEPGRAFSKKYGLTGFPHVLALDGQGRVLRPIPMLFNENVYLNNLDLSKPVVESAEAL
jgi:thiol:disulfide interchange protein